MKLFVRNLLLSLLFMFFINFNGYAQDPCAPGGANSCPSGQRCCGGTCKASKDCAPGNPPPPGLVVPIDTNISLLLAAGLGLGMFYLISSGKKGKA
tara:strand:- start:718 stop:1005 length:288 start_codon:yes stop_codon:yes gene_type:complete